MTTKKPSHEEEEFFAKEEANRLHALVQERARKMQEEERERLKRTHWMHCPKDGFELQSMTFKGVTIERCFNCNGTWLDAGELETLAGKESDFLRRVISVFRG
jgi:hypothetical protein